MTDPNFDRAERDYLTPPDYDLDERDDTIEEQEEQEAQILALEISIEDLQHELEQYKQLISCMEEIKAIQDVRINNLNSTIGTIKSTSKRWQEYGEYWYDVSQKLNKELSEFKRQNNG